MKAVLIIDVPDNILLDFCKANIEIKENAYIVSKDENAWKYTKPIKIEDVPLKPLPQKMTMEKALKMERAGAICDIYTTWDACLREITGETE